MSKHTPTRWQAQGLVIFGDVDNPKHDGDSPLIGRLHDYGAAARADAAFIVTAVNHHDELVRALQATLDTLFDHDRALWQSSRRVIDKIEWGAK